MDRTVIAETNRRVIEQFRAGGPVDGMHRERLLLLTTTGRRSGRPHTVPMMFHRDGDRILVVASNAGAPGHPDWYRNLTSSPAVMVELPDRSYDAVAEALPSADRDRTWAMLKEAYPFFADHEAGVDREIPVVALNRTAAA